MVVGAAAASERQSVMRRKMLKLAGALSLLLCVATSAVWVRSYWIADMLGVQIPQFGDPTRDDSIKFYTGRGGLFVGLSRAAAWERGVRTTPERRPEVLSYGTRRPFYPVELNLRHPDVRGIRWAGFEFTAYHDALGPSGFGSGVIGKYYAVTPCWFWVGVWLVGPTVWWWRRPGRSALACATCGYDLRATPDRCPECGSVPERRARAAA